MKQEIQGKLYMVAELLGAKVMPSYSDNCRYLERTGRLCRRQEYCLSIPAAQSQLIGEIHE